MRKDYFGAEVAERYDDDGPMFAAKVLGTTIGDVATTRVEGTFSLVYLVFDTICNLTTPAALDLIARLAGMRLRERWQDWNLSPFTSESRKHVSVWER